MQNIQEANINKAKIIGDGKLHTHLPPQNSGIMEMDTCPAQEDAGFQNIC